MARGLPVEKFDFCVKVGILPHMNTKNLQILKMDQRRIRRFFVNLKILRRYEDFQREMVNFCHLEMSLCPSLEQNLIDENQNFFNGNYSYIFSSNLYIFWNLLDNFFQKNVKFSQKSSESSASNLRSFKDSSTLEDEDGSSEASLQLCYVHRQVCSAVQKVRAFWSYIIPYF